MTGKSLLLLTAVALLFSGMILYGDSQADARSAWMEGYVKMEAGDRAATASNDQDALKNYQDALAVFERVRRKYPTWNQSLLNYRINYCKERIAKLSKMPARQPIAMQQEELAAENKQQKDKISTLEAEKRTLQSRVEILTETLERARREAVQTAGTETALQEATATVQEQKNTIAKLELQIQNAQRELKTLRQTAGLADELKTARQALDTVRNQLLAEQQAHTAAQAKVQQLTNETNRQKIANDTLQRQQADNANALKIAKELTDAQKLEIDAAQARLNTLQGRLNDLQKTLDNRNAELTETRALKQALQNDLEELQASVVEAIVKADNSKTVDTNQLRQQLKKVSERGVATNAETKQGNAKLVNEVFSEHEKRLALSEEASTLRLKLQKIQGEYEKLQSQMQVQRESQTTAKNEADRLKLLTRNLQTTLETMKTEQEKRTQEATTLQQRTLTLQNSVQTLTKDNTELTEAKRQLAERLETLQIALKTETDKLQELAKAKSTSDANLKTANDKIAELQDLCNSMAQKTGAADGLVVALTEAKDAGDKAEKENAVLRQKLLLQEGQLREAEVRERTMARQIAGLMRGGTTPEAVTKNLKSVTEQLTAAQTRVKALEAALAEVGVKTTEADPKNISGLASDTPKDDNAERQRRERETKALVSGYIHQGLDAERQGKPEAAKWNYEKALKLQGDNKQALQRLGQIAYQAGDDKEAIRYLKHAFYHDPDDAETLFALGYSYTRMTQPNWAVATMGRAVALNPENPIMLRVYGASLAQLGWTQASENVFRKALQLNPDDKEAVFNLAVLLMHKVSERGQIISPKEVAQLRSTVQNILLPKMDTQTQKLTLATLVWLDTIAKDNDKNLEEARFLYAKAKKLGMEPDPALEKILTEPKK